MCCKPSRVWQRRAFELIQYRNLHQHTARPDGVLQINFSETFYLHNASMQRVISAIELLSDIELWLCDRKRGAFPGQKERKNNQHCSCGYCFSHGYRAQRLPSGARLCRVACMGLLGTEAAHNVTKRDWAKAPAINAFLKIVSECKEAVSGHLHWSKRGGVR